MDIQPVTALVVAVAALLTYLLGRKQSNDAWFETYEKLHGDFWISPTNAKMRRMITNPQAYQDLHNVLERRHAKDGVEKAQEGSKPTVPDKDTKTPNSDQINRDSEILDELDTYLTQLLRLSLVPRRKAHTIIWHALVREYWLGVLSDPKYEKLGWYVWRFYPHYKYVDGHLRRTLVGLHGDFEFRDSHPFRDPSRMKRMLIAVEDHLARKRTRIPEPDGLVSELPSEPGPALQ